MKCGAESRPGLSETAGQVILDELAAAAVRYAQLLEDATGDTLGPIQVYEHLQASISEVSPYLIAKLCSDPRPYTRVLGLLTLGAGDRLDSRSRKAYWLSLSQDDSLLVRGTVQEALNDSGEHLDGLTANATRAVRRSLRVRDRRDA